MDEKNNKAYTIFQGNSLFKGLVHLHEKEEWAEGGVLYFDKAIAKEVVDYFNELAKGGTEKFRLVEFDFKYSVLERRQYHTKLVLRRKELKKKVWKKTLI